MAAVTLIISDKPEDVTDYKSGLRNTSISGRGKNEDDPDWGELKKAGAKETTPDADKNKVQLRHFENSREAETISSVMDNNASEEVNVKLYQHAPTELMEYEKSEILIEEESKEETVKKSSHETPKPKLKKTEAKEKNSLKSAKEEQNKLTEFVKQKSTDQEESNDLKISMKKNTNVDKEPSNKVKNTEISNLAEIEKSKIDEVTNDGAKIINKLPETSNCNLNEKITLEVKVKGNPKPTIIWYFDDKEIKQNKDFALDKVNDEEYKLNINKMDKQFCGRYSVKATNSLGEDNSNCILNLMHKPEILENLKDVTVNETESVEFQIKWSSFPIASPIWFEDNIELNAPSENYEITTDIEKAISNLKIRNCQINQNNQKTYFVKLTNVLGCMESKKGTLTINCNYFYKKF
jgi:hypothetical protein